MKNGFLKIVSLVLILLSVLTIFVSGYGIKDVLAEKERKQAEKAEKVEQLEAYKEGLKKLEENRQTYEDGKKKLAEGEKQYAAGKAELAAGEQKYAQGAQILAAKTKELKDGWAALNKAKEELEAGQKKYDAGLAQYNEKLEQYNAGRAALEAKKADYNKAKQGVAMLGELYDAAAPLVKAYQDAEAAGDDEAKKTARDGMAQINSAIQGNPALQAMDITDCFKLVGAYNQMQTGIKAYEDNKALLDKAEQDLTAGKQLLDENKLKLDAGRKAYEEGLKKAENGEMQLAQGQAALTGSAARLEAGKARLSAAESELKAGREKLAEFEAGEKKIKAAEAEMKKNEDIKMNLAQNPSLSLAEAFRKALDDATVKTTKELTTRAAILGAVGLAAALLFIAGVFGLFSKHLGVLALLGAALSVSALVFTFTGERGITPLQIAAAAALTVAGVVYFPAGKFAKAPVKAAR